MPKLPILDYITSIYGTAIVFTASMLKHKAIVDATLAKMTLLTSLECLSYIT